MAILLFMSLHHRLSPRPSHRSIVVLIALFVGGCSPSDNARSSATSEGSVPSGVIPPLQVRNARFPISLDRVSRGIARGRVEGDSTVRLLVQPNPRTERVARLCGVLATGTKLPTDLDWSVPVDSATPRLAQRLLTAGDVHGVRVVVPGRSARYLFTGITRDGSQIVKMQWPVEADPTRPVPVGAPDSVVEAALRPSVFALDSLVASLVFVTPPDTVWPSLPAESVLASASAVVDERMLPVHIAKLTPACSDVTLALPMYARADHTVKIPVHAGDVITAHAGVGTGNVQIAFDEAADAQEPASATRATMEAGRAGEVTLRVRLQVLPKVQLARQTVLVRIQRTRPPR